MKEKFVINLEAHLAIFNEEIQASLVGYFNLELKQKS